MKKILLALGLLGALTACNEEQATLFTNDKPVVEAYLRPGQPVKVRITTPYAYEGQTQGNAVTGLTVKLWQGDSLLGMREDSAGVYVPDEAYTVMPLAQYRLEFDYKGTTVSAETQVPALTSGFQMSDTILKLQEINISNGPPSGGFDEPPTLTISWDNPAQNYHIVAVENTSTSADPVFTGTDAEIPSFRQEPTKANKYEIRGMQFTHYARYRVILYRVQPDYVALYQDNGNSSISLQDPATAIVNGWGVFTGQTSDTLFLRVQRK